MAIFLGVVIAFIIGYLLGSISNGILIGKIFFGVDVRTQGSHNSGGTNTGRVLGKKFGVLTIFLDIVKTIIAIWSVLFLFRIPALSSFFVINPTYYSYIAAFSACIGHTFPVFFQFKGGKAVACLAGICLATSWMSTLVGFVVFFLVLIISKYVSLSSCLAALLIAASTFIPFSRTNGMYFNQIGDLYYSILMCAVCIFVWVRHYQNINRLIHGTENKIHWLKHKENEAK